MTKFGVDKREISCIIMTLEISQYTRVLSEKLKRIIIHQKSHLSSKIFEKVCHNRKMLIINSFRRLVSGVPV